MQPNYSKVKVMPIIKRQNPFDDSISSKVHGVPDSGTNLKSFKLKCLVVSIYKFSWIERSFSWNFLFSLTKKTSVDVTLWKNLGN